MSSTHDQTGSSSSLRRQPTYPLLSPPTRPSTPSSAPPQTCTPTRPPPPWPPCPKLWTRCKAARPATAGRAGLTPPWLCCRRAAAWPWEGLLRDSTAANTTNSSSSSSSSSSWEGSLSTTPVLLTSENSTSTPTCKELKQEDQNGDRDQRGAQSSSRLTVIVFNPTLKLSFLPSSPEQIITGRIYVLIMVTFFFFLIYSNFGVFLYVATAC